MIRREGTRVVLSGPVTLENARAVLEEGSAQIRSGARSIDLGEVSELDSSLLAVLLVWQREARSEQGMLAMEQVPEGLATIARLYGVEAFLTGAAPGH